MGNITPGFEGDITNKPGAGTGEPGGESDPLDQFLGRCWDVMVAHIDFNVTTAGNGLRETGWSTKGTDGQPSLETVASTLSDGEFPKPWMRAADGSTANIIKQCVCISKKDTETQYNSWGIPISFGFNSYTAGFIGLPYNGGRWYTENNINSKIVDAFKQKKWRVPTDHLFPGVRRGRGIGYMRKMVEDHYLFVSMKVSCEPCAVFNNFQYSSPVYDCPCDDGVMITLDINDKSKEYEASDGSKVTFSNPGNRMSVIQEVMAAEQAIPLNCGGIAS